MNIKIISGTIAIIVLSLFFTTGALAKAKLKKVNLVISPNVAKNKRSVSLYLANLQKTISVTYSLSYVTDGKSEGAGGTIKTKGKYSLSRNLLFGTCSNKVCRYHKKIKNAQLTVVVTYLDGTSITKTFKLRV